MAAKKELRDLLMHLMAVADRGLAQAQAMEAPEDDGYAQGYRDGQVAAWEAIRMHLEVLAGS
ncbi:protein of unknown function [Candidatus Hydrogenisulfobacillus filiaventi]|uniref:Uncharacterized protein n=1 Tax=Candidatus Hydrogenisulfobacillus filiaventi TaxID=2707344 RepID=A0A6F8ZI22_9FIRM|nr:protein of unknown function [Candidatus Hydrogenisulfobacillus filiaventi]